MNFMNIINGAIFWVCLETVSAHQRGHRFYMMRTLKWYHQPLHCFPNSDLTLAIYDIIFIVGFEFVGVG